MNVTWTPPADKEATLLETFQYILDNEFVRLEVTRDADQVVEVTHVGSGVYSTRRHATVPTELTFHLLPKQQKTPVEWKPGDPLPEGYEVTSTSRHGAAIEARIAPVEPETTKQVVIVAVPKGYKAIDYRDPVAGELFLTSSGSVMDSEIDYRTPRIILEELDD